MRKINYFIKAMIVCIMPLATLLSCDKDDSGPVTPEKEYEISGVATVNALSARVSGSFKGISRVDLSLGKTGILYCLKSDNAESVFNDWLNGNKDADCYEYSNGKLTSDTYSGIITNLYPDKDYNYCLYCIGRDGKSFKMSDILTFHTAKLEPDFRGVKSDSVRYTKAVVKGSVYNIDNDASSCSCGVLLTDGENDVVNADSKTFENKGVKRDWRILANGLTSDSLYCCRTYIKYKTHDNLVHYVYGPSVIFRTWNLDDWAVDLGLDSGIRWSKCELGREDFDDLYDLVFNRDKIVQVRWGSVLENYYDDYEVYEYWNDTDESYINIGNEISGTKYDIAHTKLGGHWRLPTKAEVEELISNCSVTFDELTKEIEYSSGSSTYTTRVTLRHAILKSKINDNDIKIMMSNYWTGTLDESEHNDYTYYYPYGYAYCMIIDKTLNGYIQVGDGYYRDNWMLIRPVWDPNLE